MPRYATGGKPLRILLLGFVAVAVIVLGLSSSLGVPISPLHEAQEHPNVGRRTPAVQTGVASRDSEDQHRVATAASITPRQFIALSCFHAKPDFYHGREVPNTDWIVVFIRSFLTVVPSKRSVVLFVDDGTKEKLLRYRGMKQSVNEGELLLITIVNDSTTPFLREPWAAKVKNGANNFRFALYAQWLLNAKNAGFVAEATRIVISDATDVAFQRNPFSGNSVCFPPEDRSEQQRQPVVIFTLENELKTFKNEKYNRRWLGCYGDSTLNHFAMNRVAISCAGLTLGNTEGVVKYAQAQIAEISKPKLVSCSISKIDAALDQATHNFLRQTWKEENKSLGFSVAHSTPCTFHGNFGKLKMVKDPLDAGSDVAVNGKGEVYAIVHQFTSGRHPPVMEAMARRYLS